MPYIVIHYYILLYIALIRNRSLLTKLVEIGRRAGGITGVSRNSTPPLKLKLLRDRVIVVLGKAFYSLYKSYRVNGFL